MIFDDPQLQAALRRWKLPWIVDFKFTEDSVAYNVMSSDGQVVAKFLIHDEARDVCCIANALYREQLRRSYIVSDLEEIIDRRIRAAADRAEGR